MTTRTHGATVTVAGVDDDRRTSEAPDATRRRVRAALPALLARGSARVVDAVIVGLAAGLVVAAVGVDPTAAATVGAIAVVHLGYFVVFESRSGATPGKRLAGLVTRGVGGGPPAVGAAALRNLWLLLLPFGLLGVTAVPPRDRRDDRRERRSRHPRPRGRDHRRPGDVTHAGDALDRRGLRAALVAGYPWVDAPEVGPRAVAAGECDRCGRHPRFVPTCGPTAWEALCPDCAVEVGLDAWCDGHEVDGRRVLAALPGLPAEWDLVSRLWWVATGEVRLHALVVERPDRLPPAVRAALP